jgi:hypothetical protein
LKHGPDSKVFRTRRAGPCRPTTGCLKSTGVGLATMDHDAGCDKVWKARPGFGPEERQVAQAADRRQSGSERLPGCSTGKGVVGSAMSPGCPWCGWKCGRVPPDFNVGTWMCETDLLFRSFQTAKALLRRKIKCAGNLRVFDGRVGNLGRVVRYGIGWKLQQE